MHDKVRRAVVSLHVAAAFYLLLAVLYLLSPFVKQLGDHLLWGVRGNPVLFALVMFMCLLAMAGGFEVVAAGLRKRKFWAWWVGNVVFGLFVCSPFFPLGLLGYWTLNDPATRAVFGVGPPPESIPAPVVAKTPRALRILLIVNGVLLIFSCFPVALLLNSVNPMAVAFVTEFTIVNETAERIHVTPVGTVGTEGRKALLPIYVSRLPALPSGRVKDFPIEPGDSLRLLYDWDDINFSEIVIRDAEDNLYQLVVDPTPTRNQYHPPAQSRFVIEDLHSLAAIDPKVLEAQRWQTRGWLFWPLVGLCSVPLLTFLFLLRARRRALRP